MNNKKVLDTAVANLKKEHFHPIVVESKEEALQKIKELIPQGASVMNGMSTTLEQIGYVDYLKSGKHGWNNLHEHILAETDPTKQAEMRRHAVISDYYVGSVHALSATGELVVGTASGSQYPNLVYTSPNNILVVSTKKITKDLPSALKRLEEHVVPLEDARLKKLYGVGTFHSMTLIMHKIPPPPYGRNIQILLVKEDLGF